MGNGHCRSRSSAKSDLDDGLEGNNSRHGSQRRARSKNDASPATGRLRSSSIRRGEDVPCGMHTQTVVSETTIAGGLGPGVYVSQHIHAESEHSGGSQHFCEVGVHDFNASDLRSVHHFASEQPLTREQVRETGSVSVNSATQSIACSSFREVNFDCNSFRNDPFDYSSNTDPQPDAISTLLMSNAMVNSLDYVASEIGSSRSGHSLQVDRIELGCSSLSSPRSNEALRNFAGSALNLTAPGLHVSSVRNIDGHFDSMDNCEVSVIHSSYRDGSNGGIASMSVSSNEHRLLLPPRMDLDCSDISISEDNTPVLSGRFVTNFGGLLRGAGSVQAWADGLFARCGPIDLQAEKHDEMEVYSSQYVQDPTGYLEASVGSMSCRSSLVSSFSAQCSPSMMMDSSKRHMRTPFSAFSTPSSCKRLHFTPEQDPTGYFADSIDALHHHSDHFSSHHSDHFMLP